jgi:arabinoxylan arabinofuranohydrolase
LIRSEAMRSRKPVTFSRRRFLERCLGASAGIAITPRLATAQRPSVAVLAGARVAQDPMELPETYTVPGNPIVPPGIYIADPSAHVWSDGKLYVYGSRDESPDYYCSWSYRVLSSDDLETWDMSGESFASRGPNDQVPYNDELLFAPDVQYRDGKYYLYYCQPDRRAEGVAVSDAPNGPFVNGTPIDVGNFNQIDPCAFIDDDGQAYYVWGQFSAKMAKLKPNMTELDLDTIQENVVTERDHYFHEGAYLVKRNGLYYLVYADVSRGGAPTCIGYAVAESPMGPYEYGGVIVDNKFCDPEVWNNHGSLVEFKSQWYVFYHRATNATMAMRKPCIEPIAFNEDGSITEVQMTTQGAAGPLDAFAQIDAARACLLRGSVRVSTLGPDREALAEIRHGNEAAFKYLDFKGGADRIELRVSPGPRPCRITVSADSRWTGRIGTVEVPARGSDEWITVTAPVQAPTGVRTLWLGFVDPNRREGRYGFPLGDEQQDVELCKVDAVWFG